MRFIQKTQSPDFFEEEKQRIPLTADTEWREFQNPCKNQLKSHLLQEQDQLCIYCECDLSGADSHLEHLIPQEKDPQRRFDYFNLAVSCEGKSPPLRKSESCGHRKSNEYDAMLFLNPVAKQDINSCFQFDPQTAAIKAAAASEAADYMIQILNLNAAYLLNARLHAKQLLVAHLSSITDDSQFEAELNSELSQPREFVSFLRHAFGYATE